MSKCGRLRVREGGCNFIMCLHVVARKRFGVLSRDRPELVPVDLNKQPFSNTDVFKHLREVSVCELAPWAYSTAQNTCHWEELAETHFCSQAEVWQLLP